MLAEWSCCPLLLDIDHGYRVRVLPESLFSGRDCAAERPTRGSRGNSCVTMAAQEAPDLKQQLYEVLSGTGSSGEGCWTLRASSSRLKGCRSCSRQPAPCLGGDQGLTEAGWPLPAHLRQRRPLHDPPAPAADAPWTRPLVCSAGPLTRISPGLRVAGSSMLKVPLQAEQVAAIKAAASGESSGSGVWVLPAEQLEVTNPRGCGVAVRLLFAGCLLNAELALSCGKACCCCTHCTILPLHLRMGARGGGGGGTAHQSGPQHLPRYT